MGRTNQASRKCNKTSIILVLCLCAWHSVFAAIVMETPKTELKIFVTDRKEERDNTLLSSLQLPLCSIVITAKHKGKGYLQIFHTPLTNGVEEVSYQLFYDDRHEILPSVISYDSNPFLPLTIPIMKLSANLIRPLLGDHSSYSSDVVLHLMLDM